MIQIIATHSDNTIVVTYVLFEYEIQQLHQYLEVSMLLSMTTLKRIIVSLFVASLVACGVATPVPTVTTTMPSHTLFIPSITPSPILTVTPLPTNTSTATLEPGTPPGCMIHDEDGTLYVLSEKEFFAFGPSESNLDEVLVGNYPDWSSFKQTVSWYSEPVKVGTVIEAASFREQYNFNPAVTLVTLGESLDWQIPADGDLYSRALQTSEALIRPALDWIKPENEQLRAQYPQIANGATYALYIFFGQDEGRLQTWCNTYQQLFGISSLHP